ncbi:hypothetical protein [Szabonella alba]|uniref:Uncharacterized protein n=1 Tax=Szabonella alba TaxID=2804194 RepID=A0A8K0VER3_9RHOB|nr:hypothetical protein [Szabonella alba]MBL4918329.1 hypothetical protein [Szabonella alba]
MTAHVMAFRPKERVQQDAGPIALLYRTMGTQAAEEVVTRALGEVMMTIAGLAGAGLGGQSQGAAIADLSRPLRRLQRMSEQLGLVSLGLVAGDARDCLDHGDRISFAAVLARLIRVAEISLAPEPGLLDHSR